MPTEAFSQAVAALGDESQSDSSGVDSVAAGADSGESVETSTASQPESSSEGVSEGAAGGVADSGQEAAAEAAPEPDGGNAKGADPTAEWTPDGRSVPLNRFQEVIAQRNDLRFQMQQMQQQMQQIQQAQQIASFMNPRQQQSPAQQYGGHSSEDEYINSLLGIESGQGQVAPNQYQANSSDQNQMPQWATSLQSQFQQFQDYIGQQQLASTVKELQSIYPNVPDWALYQGISVGMDPEQVAIQFQGWANGISPAEAPAAAVPQVAAPAAAPRPQTAPSAGKAVEGDLSAADLADPKKRKNLALQALEKVPFP